MRVCGICETPTDNGEFCKQCEKRKDKWRENINKVLIRKGKRK